MSSAAARWLAWGLSAVAVGLLVAGISLTVAAPTNSVDLQDGFLTLIVLGFSTIGVLIASSPQRNPLCWVYCGVAVWTALAELAHGYVESWLAGQSGSRTLGELAAIHSEYAWMGWIMVPATYLLLLFPDGHPLTPRWRVVAWGAGLGIGIEYVGGLLTPGPVPTFPTVDNPYGVAIPWPVTVLGIVLVVIAVVASPVSLLRRFRRASGVQRQQIKWLAYAGAVAAPVVLVIIPAYELFSPAVANAIIQLAVLLLPMAAGVAILRYRLYDIDVVINRTLVYAVLTATLAASYLVGVLLLQFALGPLTQRSELAVAGSTLAVAALFRPARRRIQGFVDRRFYRSRYDARRTLESFSGRLREQLDVDALQVDLSAVVRETLQPAHVPLWLRETGR